MKAGKWLVGADAVTDDVARVRMKACRAKTLDAIARAVRYALEQPRDVDVYEIVVRPKVTRLA